MAAVPIQASTPIPLHVQLGTNATGKYPLAILRDAAGNTIAGSPVALVDIGQGMYQSNAFNMPNTQFVIASYLIYDDAGHTVLSDDDQSGVDVFYLAPESLAPVRKDRVFGIVVARHVVAAALGDGGRVQGVLVGRHLARGVVTESIQVRGVLGQQTVWGVVGCD